MPAMSIAIASRNRMNRVEREFYYVHYVEERNKKRRPMNIIQYLRSLSKQVPIRYV